MILIDRQDGGWNITVGHWNYLTVSIRHYRDTFLFFGIRRLGWPKLNRFAIDLGCISLVFEWWYQQLRKNMLHID